MRPASAIGIGISIAVLNLTGCASLPPRSDPSIIGEHAAQYALDMKGKPYHYGGNTPRGFDCSGLVQYSYARAGMRVPRTTEGLWGFSRAISTHSLQPGDLLFFNQQGKRSSHVAIYIGGGRFVHAPSTGRYVSVGSVNAGYWRRHLESARRLQLHQ